jgi:hypothetical protein
MKEKPINIKEGLETWMRHIELEAYGIIKETDKKSDGNFKHIKEKAQEIIRFIEGLEKYELKRV